MKNDSKKAIIIAMSIFLCFLFIDETSVAVTLPNIQADFNMTDTALQWVMSGMFLPLAVLVLFSGKLSDIFGHRRLFVSGVVLMLAASILCTLSNTGSVLILGRVFQGIAASMLLSTYAVLISIVFPENERGMALGTCASMASIFLATGPFIGGAIAHYLSWRYVFALNVPLGALCIYFVYRAVGADKVLKHASKIDYKGVAFFIIGFASLIFALMQAVVFGWFSEVTVSLFILAVILLSTFIWAEKKHPHPLVNLALFKNKVFSAGNIILLCTQVVVMSLTYWAIWLQKSLNLSPLVAGLGLLPAGLPILFMARLGGIWMDKHGAKFPISIGSVIVLIGMLWLTLTAPYQHYWLAFWGFLAYGMGAPLMISPAIATVLGSVEAKDKGMASGILNTMRQLGAALCFAVVGVGITNTDKWFLARAIKAQHLSGMTPQIFEQFFEDHHVIAGRFDEITIQTIYNTAYSHAFAIGMGITTVFALIACYVACVRLKADHFLSN